MVKVYNPTMLALDTSSESSGFAIYRKGVLREHGHLDHFKRKEGDLHSRNMCNDLLNLLDEVNPSIVVIEEPADSTCLLNGHTNLTTHLILCIIIGVVRGWCLNHDCEFNLINISTWRNALRDEYEDIPKKRKELKEWAKMITGLEDDNEADAVLIGRAWLKIWDRSDLCLPVI